MRFFKILSVTFFVLFFSSGILAQEALSLSQAIETGLRNNYQIQIAERKVDLAKNNNNLAAAGRYPNINFNLSSNNGVTNEDNPPSFIKGAFFNGGLTGNVDLAWTLFDGYKVSINKKRFEELERQGQGNSRLAIENTTQQIILAYNQVLIQQERLRVLGEVLKLSRDRVEYQQVRREFGQAGTFDVLQSNDAYLNDSTNILIQEQSFATAMRNLNLTMGVEELSTVYQLTDPLSFDDVVYDFAELQGRLFDNNITLQNLYFTRNLAGIEREFQESNRFPTVRANTGVNAAGSLFKLFADDPQTGDPYNARTGSNTNFYVNFTASYRLYDAGARKRNIQNAQIQESIAQLSIDDVKRTLSLQLRNTLETYRNQLQLIQLTESLIENARRNLEIAEERFKSGQVSSFDYRSIQLGYINASQSRLNAIFNLKNTETELIRLTGGLLK